MAGPSEVSVYDTGTEHPAGELPHLSSVSPSGGRSARSDTYDGQRIGLALVQELVKLHGGEISMHSELGPGGTFSIAFPVSAQRICSRDRLADRARRFRPPCAPKLMLTKRDGMARRRCERPTASLVSGGFSR